MDKLLIQHRLFTLFIIGYFALSFLFQGGYSLVGQLFVYQFPILLLSYVRITDNRFFVSGREYFGYWPIFLLISLVSTIFSHNLSYSVPVLLLYVSYFTSFVLVQSLVTNKLYIKIFYNSLIGLTVLGAIVFLLYATGVVGPPSETMTIFYPSYGHSHVAYLLLAGLVSLIVASVWRGTQMQRGQVVLVIFLFLFLLLTFSRSALFIFIGILIFTAFVRRKHLWGGNSVLMIVLTIFAIIVSIGIMIGLRIPLERPPGAFWDNGTIQSTIFKKTLSGNRFIYWKQSLQHFLENPVIGSGLDTFRFTSRRLSEKPNVWSWYAHNHYLQLFGEIGFVGGLMFVAMIVLFLYSSYRYVRRQGATYQEKGIFGAILSMALLSVVDFSWQFSSFFLLFWVLLACIVPKQNSSSLFIPVKKTLVRICMVLLLVFVVVRSSALFFTFGGNHKLSIALPAFLAESHLGALKSAIAQEEEGQIYRSMNALKRLARDDVDLFDELFTTYQNSINEEQQISMLELLISNNPQAVPKAYTDLWKLYIKKGEIQEARRIMQQFSLRFEMGTQRIPDKEIGDGFFALSVFYLEKDGEVDLSLKYLVDAIQANPWNNTYVEQYLYIGKLFQNKEFLQNAAEYRNFQALTSAFDQVPVDDFGQDYKTVASLYRAYATYVEESNPDLALRLRERAIRIDPWDMREFIPIFDYYDKRENPTAIRRVLHLCLSYFPNDHWCKKQLARFE